MGAEITPVHLAGYFLEWDSIEDAKAVLADRSKALFKAMKDEGFDTKAARVAFREKRIELIASPEDVSKAEADEAVLDLYRVALTGGLKARARPAHARVENIDKTGAAKPVTDTQEQPETATQSAHVNEVRTSDAGTVDDGLNAPAGSGSDEMPAPHSPSDAASSDAVADTPSPPPATATLSGDDDFDPSKLWLNKDRAPVNERCEKPLTCKYGRHPQKLTCSTCTTAWAIAHRKAVAA